MYNNGGIIGTFTIGGGALTGGAGASGILPVTGIDVVLVVMLGLLLVLGGVLLHRSARVAAYHSSHREA